MSREVWGDVGVLTSAAVLGLTDVDALTVSMARGVAEAGSAELAALAIAIGVLANTVLKLSLALLFGETRFRAIAGGTLAVMVLAAAAVLLLHPPLATHSSEIDAGRDQAAVAVARPAPAQRHQGSASAPLRLTPVGSAALELRWPGRNGSPLDITSGPPDILRKRLTVR